MCVCERVCVYDLMGGGRRGTWVSNNLFLLKGFDEGGEAVVPFLDGDAASS